MSASEQWPTHLGDYTLIRPIGRGSYGEVFLAQSVLGHYRAIKIIRRGSFSSARPFDREVAGLKRFEPISRSHPGFVAILHVGTHDPEADVYCVMELADDLDHGREIHPNTYKPKTLSALLERDGRLPPEECIRVGLSLADALVELHGAHFVHRDIKPSNVIFVGGVPRLADIGLVAAIDNAKTYVGTQGFIPPEGPGSVQSDIFSLGKVLYESMSGKDRQEFPSLPTLLDQEEPLFFELNEIILRAAHYDRKKRFQSASDLKGELALLQSGKSIKRLRALERHQRIYRTAGLCLLASVVVAMPVVVATRVHQARMTELDVRETVIRNRQTGELLSEGIMKLSRGDCLRALPLLSAALLVDRSDADLVGQELRIGLTLAHAPRLVGFVGLGSRINAVVPHPEGGAIAAGFFDKLYFLNADGSARREAAPVTGLVSATLSADGKFAVTASQWTGEATVWDWDTGEKLFTLNHPKGINAACFSADNHLLVTGCKNGILYVWDLVSRRVRHELHGHDGSILNVVTSRDGRFAASGGSDQHLIIWDIQSGSQVGLRVRTTGWIGGVAFSPDGQKAATGDSSGRATVWDLERQVAVGGHQHESFVRHVEFSPDNRFLLSASDDGLVRIVPVTSTPGDAALAVLPHSHRVMHASFTKDGRRIWTACADGTVRLWDLAPLAWLPEEQNKLLSPTGRYALHREGEDVLVFDNTTSTLVRRIRSRERVRFADSDNGVIAGNQLYTLQALDQVPLENGLAPLFVLSNGRILVCHTQSWELLGRREYRPARFEYPKADPFTNAAVSALRSEFAVAFGKKLELRDSGADGKLLWRRDYAGVIKHLEFSPSGKTLVVATSDDNLNEHAAEVRDVRDGTLLKGSLYHRDGILHATFSPSSRYLATSGEDNSALIWDLKTSKAPAVLHHASHVTWSSFSHDDRLLVTVSAGHFRVWVTATGRPVTPLVPLFRSAAHPRFVGYRVCWNLNDERCFEFNLQAGLLDKAIVTKVAEFLGSEQVPGAASDVRVPQLLASWHELKSLAPAQFQVTAQEGESWTTWSLKVAQSEGDLSAARFYETQRKIKTGNSEAIAGP